MVTLNVSDLNIPIKRVSVDQMASGSNWQYNSVLSKGTDFKYEDRLKVNGWRNIYHAKTNQKKV